MTNQLLHACKKSLSVTHHNPLSFVICEWQKKPQPNGIYLVYKVLISLYFSTTLIYTIVDPDHFHCSLAYKVKWLVYLTHWTHILCALQAIWSTVMLFMCFKAQLSGHILNDQKKALKTYKFYWTIHTISVNMSVIVVIFYWTTVYNSTIPLDVRNYVQHVFNTVVMTIDIFIVSHPVRFLHLFYPWAFGLFYGLFSALYCFSGGTNQDGNQYVYKTMDWTKTPGKSAVTLFGTGFLCMALHIVYWFLYRVRVKLRFVSEKDKHLKQHGNVYDATEANSPYDMSEC